MNTSLLDANVSQNGHIAMWFADLVEPFHLKTVVSLQAYGKGNHGCAADYTIEPRRWKLNSNPLTSQIFHNNPVLRPGGTYGDSGDLSSLNFAIHVKSVPKRDGRLSPPPPYMLVPTWFKNVPPGLVILAPLNASDVISKRTILEDTYLYG